MMKILSFIQRGYWLHLVLVLIIAGEIVAAKRGHLTDDEVDALFESGTPREKVYALHLIASRGDPRFTRDDVVPTLQSDESLVREVMMTSNMMRFRNERIRNRQMSRWRDEASLRRARILMDYRIGNFMSLTLAQVDAFLAAADRDP